MLNHGTQANREHLHADCQNCFGLCCVALPFSKSADFSKDKEGGTPCSHLQCDFRCSIHENLRGKGYRGCTVYECFGAGQKVSQHTFRGKDWREHPEVAEAMFQTLPIMQQLQEMLWYLTEALTLKVTAAIHDELRRAIEKTEKHTLLEAESILSLDVATHRAEINLLLLETSHLVREETKRKYNMNKIAYPDRGADLIGANLAKRDLKGCNFRGAYLIAANMQSADLRGSDFIGADMRDTDLRGANLSECIFLTQDQLNAANGDIHTKLPSHLIPPMHWTQM
ncbi:pentapeptide repeat-containing protein [Radiobacillus kanasensis]|uniref:pentapeptide repeat-containing protein n=1 Tax=Radiobacillus kanasensis TaxID=2844358 RepID=UPI001E3B5E00|nr:pentapeptide repeat-containing protein [Radiobacillus kanasensis]UFU00309.1 pentapeptide repeat-containing protein [Radiobacillus kanasensis]